MLAKNNSAERFPFHRLVRHSCIQDIDFTPYTHLNYFVFTTTPSASEISQAGIDDSTIIDFVTRAKAAGVKAGYTVGGWTGSKYFSTNFATAQNRTIFAKTLLAVLNKYGFDGGISIDYEYPNNFGQPGNIIRQVSPTLSSIEKLTFWG